MPSGPKQKKFYNRHVEEARARVDEKQSQKVAQREKEQEDALWVDNDPKVVKKQQKLREAEEKALAKRDWDEKKKQQEEEEAKDLASKAPKKVTQRQLQKELSKMLASYKTPSSTTASGALNEAPPELLPDGNINRLRGLEGDVPEVVAGGNVIDVVSALEEKKGGYKGRIGPHARVLFKQFCEDTLPQLKIDKPGLRRSQYNDQLWELWQKSPLNPFVERMKQQAEENLLLKKEWLESKEEDSG